MLYNVRAPHPLAYFIYGQDEAQEGQDEAQDGQDESQDGPDEARDGQEVAGVNGCRTQGHPVKKHT